MNNSDNNKQSLWKRFLFSNFFAELYYFLVFHIYMIMWIIGAVISIGILLFGAEILFPDAVHIFNYSMSDKVFSELVEDKHYHAAVAFIDIKKDYQPDDENIVEFYYNLADCYVNTGDYPKALEQYGKLHSYLDTTFKEECPEDVPESFVNNMTNYYNQNLSKEEFRIYLKMGDIANVKKQYVKLKKLQEDINWAMIDSITREFDDESLQYFLETHTLKDGFKYELIQGQYLTDPHGAICEMVDYLNDIFFSNKYNPIFKLKIINELIRMLLEQGDCIAARFYLEYALRLAFKEEFNPIVYQMFGNLSEHCYEMHDIADGRRLLKKYLWYIDKTYKSNDIDYAVAHFMEFKYLEADGDIDKLCSTVIRACKGLREQIANNFTGMTAAQREYFIDKFKPIFDYANSLLARHPSDDLAATCFENNMFLRGLLLRSETAITNAIADIGDKSLTEKYNKYVSLSKELVARQYASGPGNYLRKKNIEKELAELETFIANGCRDFRRQNENSNITINQLRKHLDDNDIVMQIAEVNNSVFALLMNRSGKVTYQPICSESEIKLLINSHGEIYVDNAAVTRIFSNIIPLLQGKNVYLSTAGVFNQIAFTALPVDDSGHIFADIANIHLVGSPADIVTSASADKIEIHNHRTILWGGIQYGDISAIHSAVSQTRGLLRGDIIGMLPQSLTEVTQIASLLQANGNNATVISGINATEKSFTNRSGKRDYILHISTHGFFHDSGAFTNPMQNSGLLFAGSQKYWSNDTIVASINETDGILRADEISKLDLTACRLVVLSACQTGLGEYNSEGVYGLQRAFKLAGVKSILMSLWSVDDSATCTLMTEFYKNLIAGDTPDIALKNAQLSLRNKGYSPDKWAAFVLLN